MLYLCCVFYPFPGMGIFGLHSTPFNYSSFYGNPYPTPNLGIIPLCEQREFIKNHETQKHGKTSLLLCFCATKLISLMTKISPLSEDRDVK